MVESGLLPFQSFIQAPAWATSTFHLASFSRCGFVPSPLRSQKDAYLPRSATFCFSLTAKESHRHFWLKLQTEYGCPIPVCGQAGKEDHCATASTNQS